MIIIKRYPNRKLYNTNEKKYVTLDGIAQLILQGDEIQILDHASGEDLTALTLTQIIFEMEKKQGGFLPRSVLTGLIQSGGQTLSSLRKTLANPLNLKVHVDIEIQRRLERLTLLGELSEEEGQELAKKLISSEPRGQDASVPSEADLEALLTSRGVPTAEDIQYLNEKLDEMASKLDALYPDDSD
jgi:polyhydroxyalkanoate synthesis repressor PhaR